MATPVQEAVKYHIYYSLDGTRILDSLGPKLITAAWIAVLATAAVGGLFIQQSSWMDQNKNKRRYEIVEKALSFSLLGGLTICATIGVILRIRGDIFRGSIYGNNMPRPVIYK